MKEPKKPSKGKLHNNQIEINPILKEGSGKKVVISWGRMNPPTVGHEKLVNRVKDLAKKNGAVAEIYLSHSQDPKKNPLSYDDKLELARIAFGPIIKKIAAKTIIDVMKALTGKYSSVTLVVGQDRVNEFETLLNKYNGKEFTFDSIDVVSAGDRDPDADGVEGMSASKMRAAASEGDAAKFKSGLPKALKRHGDDVYDMVRAGMKLAEEAELNEVVLDFAARRKRALVMRRYEKKMQAAKERMKRRIADNQKLIMRARKKAIQILRQKVAGAKGLDYANLPVADKIAIDKLVEKRKGAIGRIAARLLPKVRKAEMERVAGVMHKEDLDSAFENFLAEGDNYYTGLSPSTAAKRKAHFEKHGKKDDDDPSAYKKAPGDHRAKTKPSVYTKRYHMMYNGDGTLKYDRRFRAFRHIVRQEEIEVQSDAELLALIAEAWDLAVEVDAELTEEKAMEGLKKKAEKSGISYGTLKKVYDRGVAAWRTGHRPGTTPQQWGYARVNSFITGGKTRTTADADLAKGLKEGKHFPSPAEAIMKRALEALDRLYKSKGNRSSLNSYAFDIAKSYNVGLTGRQLADKYRELHGIKESVDDLFEDYLEEGVNDPSIFKAVFLAGGPGSGKSFIVGKTALTALGFKIVNSDERFEYGLRKAGMAPTPENIYSEPGQAIREKAKKGVEAMQQRYIDGRLGLVIDGTGKDYDKIVKQVKKLKELGYDVAMIFVNTTVETSLAQNRKRERVLPDEQVRHMWGEVQQNIGKFQNFFGNNMYIIDNSKGANIEGAVLSTYRKISAWAKKTPTNPAAKEWIAKARGLKETIDPNITPVIPPIHSEHDDKATKAMIKRHIAGAMLRADKAKKMHYVHYEEHGAGDEGTDKVVKRYKKDTPGESVNEAFESFLAEDEDACALISQADIRELEKFADGLLEKFGIDIEFTKHFGERMSDNRNNPCITIKELREFFRKVYANQGMKIKANKGHEVVLKDIQKALNMPVVVEYDRKGEIDVRFKTIMRKKNFTSPNKTVSF